MIRNTAGTNTSEGFISHITYRGLRCPIKLLRLFVDDGWQLLMRKIGDDRLPVPQKDSRGNYIYALPAGGEIAVSHEYRRQ